MYICAPTCLLAQVGALVRSSFERSDGGEREWRLPLRRLLDPDEDHLHSGAGRRCCHSSSRHHFPGVEDVLEKLHI